MKKLIGAMFSASLLMPSLSVIPVLANYEEYTRTAGTSAEFGSCTVDPITDHEWTGTVTTGARVRNVACMDGSTVITTLPVGSKVRIIGETDGWWRVKLADGSKGWVGTWLIQATEKPMSYQESEKIEIPKALSDGYKAKELSDAEKMSLREKMKGRILLEVEKNGEAWYVDVKKGKRFYMKDGASAYQLMRKHGLGISEQDYERLKAGNSELTRRLVGQILLRVHKNGEAYYISPKDGSIVYLKDGAAAFELMRKHGLGIKSSDIKAIPQE